MKKIAQKFKALSDETRLRILALLSNGEMCVCDLMAILDLPQSTVSRHLAYLRNAGWVEDRRRGVWMYYRLCDDNESFASELRDLLKRHLTNLPQATRDREALAAFRNCETTGNCG
jgi:ArsR family transcriptional regulator